MFNLKQNFIEWLFALDRSTKRLLQITYDAFATAIAFFLALILRLETSDFFYMFDTYIGVLISIISTSYILILQGLYNNITRYMSIETAISIAIGSILSCVVLLSGIFLLELDIPLSVSFIFGTILCVLLAGIRLFVRYLSQNVTTKKRENVAIFGAGAAGIQLMDALRQNPNYSVKLFIDNNPDLDGKNLGGVDIINFNRVKQKIRSINIKTMFIATSFKQSSVRQKVLDIVSEYPIKVKMIPSISKFIDSTFKIDHLKDIKIEDLLGREPVEPNHKLLSKTISNKTVLVTGAGGSIGSELCRQIVILKPKKLILMDISEFAIYELTEELKSYPYISDFEIVPLIGSIGDKDLLKKLLNSHAVDTIYHAAAYKHVPLMEQNIMQCINNNVFGTLNIADLSVAAKVKNFILVSTDKAVNPTNFMGVSKRIAEIICQNMSVQKNETCFSIVRFGNVLGSSGSVVPLFKTQIEKGGPITLTHHEVTRYFMTIPEAAQLVIQAGSIAQGGDIFVLDMGKSIKILDLAKRMVYLSGKEPVLNSNKNPKDNEIEIIISGLRPGEKLYEELTYNQNLIGTVHPRINTVKEISMNTDELQSLLKIMKHAIRDYDYQKLFENISKVSNNICDINTSTDIFLEKDAKKDSAVLIQLNKKLKQFRS